MPESVFCSLKPKMCHECVSVSGKEISCLLSPGVLCLRLGFNKCVCLLKFWFVITIASPSVASFGSPSGIFQAV